MTGESTLDVLGLVEIYGKHKGNADMLKLILEDPALSVDGEHGQLNLLKDQFDSRFKSRNISTIDEMLQEHSEILQGAPEKVAWWKTPLFSLMGETDDAKAEEMSTNEESVVLTTNIVADTAGSTTEVELPALPQKTEPNGSDPNGGKPNGSKGSKVTKGPNGFRRVSVQELMRSPPPVPQKTAKSTKSGVINT